jgi:hypothetical protein
MLFNTTSPFFASLSILTPFYLKVNCGNYVFFNFFLFFAAIA